MVHAHGVQEAGVELRFQRGDRNMTTVGTGIAAVERRFTRQDIRLERPRQVDNWVGGELRASSSGKTLPVHDSATASVSSADWR